MGELAEEVLNIVHAFSDKGRKDIIRNLALRVSGLESDLQAARLTISTIERETLERSAKWFESRDRRAKWSNAGAAECVRSLIPTKPKTCPHGLDRRAKCALCTVEGL